MKTETLYRPKNERAARILTSDFLFEKVTHVLPDQLRDDAKKLELILKIGELIHDKIELQKKVEELAKELDSWKRLPANEGRVIRESIEGQKETIESQKNEIERLKAELSNLRSYHNLVVGFANQDREGISRLIEEKNRLKSELEEAKKGVVRWEKFDGTRYGEVVTIDFNGVMHLGGSVSETEWFIPLPPRPKTRTIDDEANEAFATSVNHGFSSRSDRDGFIAGFKAAKETQNGQV